MRLDHERLARELDHFFDLARSSIYNSPVWRTLKRRLSQRGNWKNAPRGDPYALIRAKRRHQRGEMYDELDDPRS